MREISRISECQRDEFGCNGKELYQGHLLPQGGTAKGLIYPTAVTSPVDRIEICEYNDGRLSTMFSTPFKKPLKLQYIQKEEMETGLTTVKNATNSRELLKVHFNKTKSLGSF